MVNTNRRELGDFLRARRSRLTPESVGLPRHRRRRTPGLRREEVAELAGIGVDWYIRLEQGRPVTPSVSTVDALARALRLTELEHEHLRALAGGGGHRPFKPEIAPPALLLLLESLTQPAYITGRRRDLVAWNGAAEDIFGFDALGEDERNILVSMLTVPRSRALFGPGWAEEAQRMVAQFRATHDLWAGDPAFVALLRRLREGCPEFDALVGAPRPAPPGVRPQDPAPPEPRGDRLRPRELPGQRRPGPEAGDLHAGSGGRGDLSSHPERHAAAVGALQVAVAGQRPEREELRVAVVAQVEDAREAAAGVGVLAARSRRRPGRRCSQAMPRATAGWSARPAAIRPSSAQAVCDEALGARLVALVVELVAVAALAPAAVRVLDGDQPVGRLAPPSARPGRGRRR